MSDELRDWGGFGGILAEARAIEEEMRDRDRTDCPRCGYTLAVRADGSVSCPMGHFRRSQPEKVLP